MTTAAIADAVKETGTVTGTGPITLSGEAVAGARLFRDGLANGVQAPVRIQNADNTGWEVVWATLTVSSPDTLSRDVVVVSSNKVGDDYQKVSITGTVSVTLVDIAELAGTVNGAFSYAVTTGTLSGSRCSAYSAAVAPDMHVLPDGARLCLKLHAPNSAGTNLPTLTVVVAGSNVTLPITANGGQAVPQDYLTTNLVVMVTKLSASFELVGRIVDASVVPDAAAGTKGKLALATAVEVQAGSEAAKAVTSATLATTRGNAGSSIASGSSIALPADGRRFTISGTTTIATVTETAGSERPVGSEVVLAFGGALSMTHGASTIVCPSAATMAVAANDEVRLVKLATAQWKVVDHFIAAPVASGYQAFGWARVTVSGGSATVQRSGNIASVTRSSTGKFTVAFTSAAPSANYAALFGIRQTANSELMIGIDSGNTESTAGFGILVSTRNNGTVADPTSFSFAVFV